MSVHVDDVFVADKPETLQVTKEKIKEIFNILEPGKVKSFLEFIIHGVATQKVGI